MPSIYTRSCLSNIYYLSQPEVPDKYSPLILASRFGRSVCAAVLLDKGASIDVRSERRYNCLMEAIKAGHKYVVQTIYCLPLSNNIFLVTHSNIYKYKNHFMK